MNDQPPMDRPEQAYPGNVAVLAYAHDVCAEAFAAYVGRSYATSELQIGAFFPTRRNWAEKQDRTVGCIVYQTDYNLINGSLKGADR